MGRGQITQGSVLFARLETFLLFILNLKLSSANIFSLEESKICCLRKSNDLTNYTGEQSYDRVTKRNEGVYDNLKWVLKWEKK